MAEGFAVEHDLSLFVCPGHDVAHSPQSSSLRRDGSVLHVCAAIVAQPHRATGSLDSSLSQPSLSLYLNFDLLVTEQGYQVRDDTRVDDHLDLFVPSVRQVGQSPDRVHQDLQARESIHPVFR